MRDDIRDRLVAAAREARENAYSPYSGVKVGAAVLGEDGKIYCGVNIENMSYGMTVCAERVALFGMVAAGCRKYKALACAIGVAGDGAPCLACRQVMTEFCESLDIPVYMAAPEKVYEHTLREIAPLAVMPGSLPPDED